MELIKYNVCMKYKPSAKCITPGIKENRLCRVLSDQIQKIQIN